MDHSQFQVRLARNEADIHAAQRLRYQVFVQELGAEVSPEDHAAGLERDHFDRYFDHLLLLYNDEVVGVYRLMRSDMAARGIGFYGAAEFDLGVLEGRNALELGRSCVARAHRGGPGMHLLWEGLGRYVNRHRIEILFGVASFHGTRIEPLREALSYLHYNYLAPEELRVRSKAYVPLAQLEQSQLEPRRALRQIPSLIKSYLRLGGYVGDGAYVDQGFNTVDVCVLMDTGKMVRKYKDYYSRGQK